MATSIGKLSKSFLVKVLVGIIILPFVFWGMGDVFRGGNQNVIATIDSNKVSTQEFTNYLNRLNLKKEEIENLKSSNLVEKILAEYIGKKVMALEIDRLGITVNDNSLRDIITNDKLFFKNDKFSRVEYEKFLLKSGVTAPSFEKNIVKQESKRQFLAFLAGGIIIPDSLTENEYTKENQIKKIKYIDLTKYHSEKKPTQEKINEFYIKNKNFFVKEFKSYQYAEINPISLTGKNDYDKEFFKKLDTIENKILDGQSFNDVSKENNLKIILTADIDEDKKDRKNNILKELPDNLFKKMYSIRETGSPEIFKLEKKYFLAELKSNKKENRPLSDPKVSKIINDQLNFESKIENNTKIIKEISMGGFDKKKMSEFATQHNLKIKDYELKSLKDENVFTEGINKRIFLIKDGEIDLITNSKLSKNFLILSDKTKFKKLKKNSNEYEQYEAKARLNLVNKIYRTFDENLNKQYKVEFNKRTIERVKNSF